MGQDLPDDVWSQLAETWLDTGALHNMSLTSRRMHRLLVPVIFRHLEFHITQTYSGPLIVRFIRNIMRARFLLNSPDLLRHTRFFAFWQHAYIVDLMITEYVAIYGSGREDISSLRADGENFLAIIHDTIYRLIFRMPGLRELQIGNTVMTPLCYAAISSRPFLMSLRLQPRSLPNITHVTPALPHALRLRNFACDYDNWTGNDLPTDPYVADILDHCILDLENLDLSSTLLPFVVSLIPLDRTLSLQALSVEFPDDPESSDSLAVAAFFHILRTSPQIRHLDLTGEFPDVEPIHYLPLPILPKLSIFTGTSHLLKILSGGTNLVKIHILDDFFIKDKSLTQVILSPPTHLRKLSMEQVVVSQTPHELLSFIRTLAVFRNLESLDIAYENYMSWNDSVSAQDSHNTIKDLLRQLPCLRFLNIHTSSGEVYGYDIGCPISEEGDPSDRGHPSLEGIYVDFICDMWSWDSSTGWERSAWALQ